MTNAFSSQTADGSGKPKAVWVFNGHVIASRLLQSNLLAAPCAPRNDVYESAHVGWTSISIPEM
ncbi:MAG: hypothetical protein OHK0041_17030 [Anaerolineales bacterium]